MFYVLVIEDETQEIVKAIECESESRAEKVEDGLLRQMNYEKFSSKIVAAEEYLRAELARVKAERDEAVELLEEILQKKIAAFLAKAKP